MTQSPMDGRASPGHFTNYDQLYFTIADLRGRLTSFIEIAAVREETQRLELQRLREDMLQREREHEERIRLFERDHESRIRLLEQRRYVEPKTVWTALALGVSALGVFTAIINGILNMFTP
jgi:hypothetical protein